MVLGCLLAMLKRRASKRFVLAESGQDNVWDSSVDSNTSITVDRNANNTNNTEMNIQNETPPPSSPPRTPPPSSSSTSSLSQPPTQPEQKNLLTVPKTQAQVEVNQGLK